MSIEHPDNDVFVSAASTWEIAIKQALGKIKADVSKVIRQCEEAGFEELPIRAIHSAQVAGLPLHHQDPFDRILVAQALEEGLTVVSGDQPLSAYGVPVLWR